MRAALGELRQSNDDLEHVLRTSAGQQAGCAGARPSPPADRLGMFIAELFDILDEGLDVASSYKDKAPGHRSEELAMYDSGREHVELREPHPVHYWCTPC